jgi:hypothetical protein
MKSDRQYRDAALGAFIGWIGILVMCILMVLFSGCYGTYYLTDAEYSDVRESHASVTYYDNQVYWGWDNGYYYYYGKPHYYPWYYYYNTCPPSHYTHTTHIVISRPVNKPHTIRHRPNRNITVKPNRPVKNNTTIKVKTNRTNNKVKTNRTNIKTKVTNRRRPK